MNSTTPQQPGDESSFEGTSRNDAYTRAENPNGDTYNDHYRRGSSAPDLDAAAPQLHSNDMRRMNRRAIGFLVAIVLLLLILAFLLLKAATTQKHSQRPRAQTLVVPQMPQLPPTVAPKPIAQTPVAAPSMPPVQPIPVIQTPDAPQKALAPGSSLVQRREMAAQGASPTPAGAPALPSPAAHSPLSSQYGGATSAKPLAHPDTLLTQGTIIRCVLQTRIISDIPGFTSCNVTGPVYSFDGKHLLLPKGSKVFGQYGAGPVGSRLAVVWNRILTPSGIDVNMASPGVDNLGGSGVPGYLDSHWPKRISSALLISLMSDAFLYEGEKHGPNTNSIGAGGVVVQSPFQSNTAQTLQGLANQAVRQSANRAPTLSINQGTVISIYVAKDVDFSGVVSRL